MTLALGDGPLLHPSTPASPVVMLEPGCPLVAHADSEAAARARGEPWMAFCWLFLVGPMGGAPGRFISRLRSDYSDHLPVRLQARPLFTEAICFAMEREA